MNPFFLPTVASITLGPRESMTTLTNKRNGPKLPSGRESGSKAIRQPCLPHFGLRHGDIIGDPAANNRLPLGIKHGIRRPGITIARLTDAARVDEQAPDLQIDRLVFGKREDRGILVTRSDDREHGDMRVSDEAEIALDVQH